MASYLSLPTIITSRAKTAPANGVPKIEANPAPIPICIIIFLSYGCIFSSLDMKSAIAPPICTPVPSRPAEPPNKCVSTVPTYTSGAILKGMIFFDERISSIRKLLPLAAVPAQ